MRYETGSPSRGQTRSPQTETEGHRVHHVARQRVREGCDLRLQRQPRTSEDLEGVSGPSVRTLTARVAAALVAAAILVSDVSRSAQGREPGPLTDKPPTAWAIDGVVDEPFADGLEVLILTGRDDAVIESVRWSRPTDWRWSGAKLAGPERGYGFIRYFDSWPPNPFSEEYVVPRRAPRSAPRQREKG